MTEQGEFRVWLTDWLKTELLTEEYQPVDEMFESWQACAERKDKEIAALRVFVIDYLEDLKNDTTYRSPSKEKAMQEYITKLEKLIDKSGNPTPLLTGENE